MELTEVSSPALQTLAEWLETKVVPTRDMIEVAGKENLSTEQRLAAFQFWAGKRSVINWIQDEIKARESRNVRRP